MLLVVHKSLTARLLSSSSTSPEILMAEVLTPCPVVLCLVYLPGSDQDAVTSLLNSLTPIIQKHRAIILGDFNFPNMSWDALTCSSPSSKLFCDLVFEHNLQQFVREPTHCKGNILDLVLSNFPELLFDINIHSSSHLPSMSSDHYPISISIPCIVHTPQSQESQAKCSLIQLLQRKLHPNG